MGDRGQSSHRDNPEVRVRSLLKLSPHIMIVEVGSITDDYNGSLQLLHQRVQYSTGNSQVVSHQPA